MKIGTTSFGFRYQLLDPARAPSLADIINQAAELGLDLLQICENARPLALTESEWDEVVRRAADGGLEIQLGCKTVDDQEFRLYLGRSERMRSPMLRMVFEREDGGPPTREDLDRFLERSWRLLEASGVKLAIENHFDVSSRMLADAVASYPASQVGLCVDTANSLRNFEPPEQVLDLLGARAFCYHIKDFAVRGDKLGFVVEGAPLGAGRLDLDGMLDRIFAADPRPVLLAENWTPSSGVWEEDVARDAAWLRRSLAALRAAAESRAVRA